VIGAQPVVLPHWDHLLGELLGQTEALQQPHDLVVEVNRTRQTVDLAVALENCDPVAGAAQQRCQRLADRTVPNDRDIDLGDGRVMTNSLGQGHKANP